MNYIQGLKKRKNKIAVWGSGYIGLSTMAYYSKKKIKCVGFDIDKKKVDTIIGIIIDNPRMVSKAPIILKRGLNLMLRKDFSTFLLLLVLRKQELYHLRLKPKSHVLFEFCHDD